MENSKDNLISFCIPNFNYGPYLDETLASLNHQTDRDFEVVISDNCSTDNSMEIIKKWSSFFTGYNYIKNNVNVGFAANLDKVGNLATSKYMIMLSSDDIVEKGMVKTYKKFIKIIEQGNHTEKFFFGGQPNMIDSNGLFLETLSKGNKLWLESDIESSLTKEMGFNVYKVNSAEMLRRCIQNFKTPLHFITVCYSKESYHQVEGYSGSRMYNPDKWFHWKLLTEVDFIYFLDTPLFQYRWHATNQAAQQSQSQILKYWMDEYRNCFELSEIQLQKAGLSTSSIPQYFIDRCIIPYVFNYLKQGQVVLAKRLLNFGLSCYPIQIKKNKYYYPLWLLSRIPFSKLILNLITR
jgi:glycosyltransferase involved in cell wall biosynthesis